VEFKVSMWMDFNDSRKSLSY